MNEARHDLLRESVIEVRGRVRWSLAAVVAREVDIDVEPVLMGRMLRSERPAVSSREVPDPEPQTGMRTRIGRSDAQDDPNEPRVSPTSARTVGSPMQDGIPRVERPADRGQLHAVDEPAVRR